MELNEYQRLAMRTAKHDLSGTIRLAYGALGLVGEAAEVSEQVKKHIGQGHDLDRAKMVDELGDVLWYAAYVAHALGVSLADVAAGNVAKLRRRYPDGFEAERSRNREG